MGRSIHPSLTLLALVALVALAGCPKKPRELRETPESRQSFHGPPAAAPGGHPLDSYSLTEGDKVK